MENILVVLESILIALARILIVIMIALSSILIVLNSSSYRYLILAKNLLKQHNNNHDSGAYYKDTFFVKPTPHLFYINYFLLYELVIV